MGEEEEWGSQELLIQILSLLAMTHMALDWSRISLSPFLDFKIKGACRSQFVRFLLSDEIMP